MDKTESDENDQYDDILLVRFEMTFFRTILFLLAILLYFFDDNKMKMARKPGKKHKENPIGCTGEGKR